jgi:hypothetical protein
MIVEKQKWTKSESQPASWLTGALAICRQGVACVSGLEFVCV